MVPGIEKMLGVRMLVERMDICDETGVDEACILVSKNTGSRARLPGSVLVFESTTQPSFPSIFLSVKMGEIMEAKAWSCCKD